MTITLDTLKAAKGLEEAGFNSAQSEALIKIIVALTGDHLTTKADLRELELAVEAKLKDLEHRMTIRLGGMIIAATGILAALKLYP